MPFGSMPVIRFVREGRDVECYPGENLREVLCVSASSSMASKDSSATAADVVSAVPALFQSLMKTMPML